MKREIVDLLVSWIVLSIIFTKVSSDMVGVDIYLGFVCSLALVAITFVFHELAHRTVARRFGAFAEYRLWLVGLIFALALALLSGGRLIFAAPGAVYISALKVLRWKDGFSTLRNQDYGIISAVGPLTNIGVTTIFLVLNSIYPWSFFVAGAYINIFVAFFNLLPIPPLDGAKVMVWDRKVWLALFIVALVGWVGFL